MIITLDYRSLLKLEKAKTIVRFHKYPLSKRGLFTNARHTLGEPKLVGQELRFKEST